MQNKNLYANQSQTVGWEKGTGRRGRRDMGAAGDVHGDVLQTRT